MREPLKIVFVLSSYSLGGAEKQLAELIAHVPARGTGVKLHAITFYPPGSPEMSARYEAMGVSTTLIERNALPFAAFFVKLLRTIAAIRPTIVHTQLDSSPGAWGRLAAWLARVPVIVHSDLSLMTEGTRAHLWLRPHLDRVTTRFLPNAEAIADRIAATGVPRERIHVIPCGVDLSRFEPAPSAAARPRWGLPANAVVAGFLGRFARVKRVDVLLDALSRMDPTDRPDHVLLGGDGPEMPAVRERVAKDPWLSERCHLVGTVRDVPDFLSAIDYLVLPSEVEGLPNVVLEAMAMRRPVVGTRVSDVPALIGDTGLLAEPGDVVSLAEAIAKVQGMSAADREAIGAMLRRRVEDRYDLAKVAARFWQEHVELARAAGVPVPDLEG